MAEAVNELSKTVMFNFDCRLDGVSIQRKGTSLGCCIRVFSEELTKWRRSLGKSTYEWVLWRDIENSSAPCWWAHLAMLLLLLFSFADVRLRPLQLSPGNQRLHWPLLTFSLRLALLRHPVFRMKPPPRFSAPPARRWILLGYLASTTLASLMLPMPLIQTWVHTLAVLFLSGQCLLIYRPWLILQSGADIK